MFLIVMHVVLRLIWRLVYDWFDRLHLLVLIGLLQTKYLLKCGIQTSNT